MHITLPHKIRKCFNIFVESIDFCQKRLKFHKQQSRCQTFDLSPAVVMMGEFFFSAASFPPLFYLAVGKQAPSIFTLCVQLLRPCHRLCLQKTQTFTLALQSRHPVLQKPCIIQAITDTSHWHQPTVPNSNN